MIEKLLEKVHIDRKEGIKNLFIFLVMIVIGIIVMNTSLPRGNISDQKEGGAYVVATTQEETFERKLEKIISSIQGVGSVCVLISYENTTEKVPLYDTKETTTITEETDTNGGERKTRQTNNEYSIAYEETGNNKVAIVRQNMMPRMLGVLVVAEGADNSVIKEKIMDAVITVTGLSSHRVRVLAK